MVLKTEMKWNHMRYEVFTICKLRCGRETACCNNGIMLACGQAVNIAALGSHRVLPNLTFNFQYQFYPYHWEHAKCLIFLPYSFFACCTSTAAIRVVALVFNHLILCR